MRPCPPPEAESRDPTEDSNTVLSADLMGRWEGGQDGGCQRKVNDRKEESRKQKQEGRSAQTEQEQL